MDAPFWHKLEMEMLTLLFHSLWILQCNTVSADSIIHIGKTLTGLLFLALAEGRGGLGAAGRDGFNAKCEQESRLQMGL